MLVRGLLDRRYQCSISSYHPSIFGLVSRLCCGILSYSGKGIRGVHCHSILLFLRIPTKESKWMNITTHKSSTSLVRIYFQVKVVNPYRKKHRVSFSANPGRFSLYSFILSWRSLIVGTSAEQRAVVTVRCLGTLSGELKAMPPTVQLMMNKRQQDCTAAKTRSCQVDDVLRTRLAIRNFASSFKWTWSKSPKQGQIPWNKHQFQVIGGLW